MPIDPGILLGVKPPDPLPSPDEVAERQLKIVQARAQVQQTIEAAKQRKQQADDADMIQNTLLQTNGDYDAAHGQLMKISPRAASTLEKGWTANQEAQAKAATERIKAMDAQTTWEAHLIQGITPENAAVALQDVAKVNPGLAARVAPGGKFDPKLADALVAQADETKDRLNRVAKAHEYVTKDPVTFVATMIDALPDKSPQNIQATLDSAEKDYGVTPSVTGTFRQGTPEQVAQQANRLALGPAKAEEIANTKARDAQTKANEDKSRELEAQRIALETKRAASTDANERQRIGIELAGLKLRQAEFQQRTTEAAGVDLKPGTAAYRQAQDLADGTLTFQDFQRLHSRAQADAPLRAAIYDTARQLNPNFNPASFEIGFKFASSPKVKQQVASIKNVESGVDDLLKFSDAATRSGSPTLNQYAVKPIQTALGGKSYSNFKTAVTAFADELSGALGYGSATDMSREMGFNMTDMNQSPANFKSNVQDVVIPFVARKKASLIGQMGPYGATADVGSSKTVTAAQIQAVAKKNGTSVEQETARAKAEGYTVK